MSWIYNRNWAKGNQWIKPIRSSLERCFASCIFYPVCHSWGLGNVTILSCRKEVGDLARLQQCSLSHPYKSEDKFLQSTGQAQKQFTSYFQVVTWKEFHFTNLFNNWINNHSQGTLMVNITIIINEIKPIQCDHSPIHLTTSLSTLSSNLSSDLSGVLYVCRTAGCSQMWTMFFDEQNTTVPDIQPLNPVHSC